MMGPTSRREFVLSVLAIMIALGDPFIVGGPR